MPDTLRVHEPLLVNALGHWAGALIFGIFLYLLWKDRGSRLSLLAALLAFLWHATSLAVLALGERETAQHSLTVWFSSAALSLLPAVLFQLSLDGRFRPLVVTGYLLSGAAVAIHSSELVAPAPHYHRFALILITAGFGALTVLSAAGFVRSRESDRRRLASRLLGTMSLFLLAMSFAHLGEQEAHSDWAVELLLHHSIIPLALLVLLQDYRFLLLDAFLRFLANVLLAAGVTFVGFRVAALVGFAPPAFGGPFEQSLFLVAACLALVGFAVLRSQAERLLVRVGFGRPDLERAVRQLRSGGAGLDEREYLAWAAERLAAYAAAPLLEVAGQASDSAEASVPVRLPGDEIRYLLLGRRAGGRRYLSEDWQALARLSAEIVERVELIREAEMRRLVTQAELRALQSQIHPHFLFNALTTLYGVIPREAAGARQMVLDLADIFRYFLQTERTYIPVERELEIVRAYLAVEQLRLGPKLRVEIEVEDSARKVLIPALTLEPLVENAVKHGVAACAAGGVVRIEVRREGDALRVRVRDTGPGFPEDVSRDGVGLDNVRRRLRLCYGAGAGAGLEVRSTAEGAEVGYRIPAEVER